MGDGSAPRRPTLVLVTGEPGSGKSTLGRRLAAELRVPYLSRDDVRGGLLASAGLWSGSMATVPEREAAVEAFVALVETAAGLGVSAVLEIVIFGSRREVLARLQGVAECLVVVTECRHAAERVDRRDRADPLLNREGVLAALGHASIDAYLNAPQRDIVRAEMVTTFDLPTLTVRTDDDYAPPIIDVVDWIIDQTRSRTS